MQNYKEVCGNEKEVWFQLQENECETFLQWAKDLGCVWLNGKKINPQEKPTSFHYAITANGLLGKIPLFAWFSKNGQFDHIKRYMFCEFVNGNPVSPKEYYQIHKSRQQKLK